MTDLQNSIPMVMDFWAQREQAMAEKLLRDGIAPTALDGMSTLKQVVALGGDSVVAQQAASILRAYYQRWSDKDSNFQICGPLDQEDQHSDYQNRFDTDKDG